MFFENCRTDSKWANIMDSPKSAALFSQGSMHDEINVDCDSLKPMKLQINY